MREPTVNLHLDEGSEGSGSCFHQQIGQGLFAQRELKRLPTVACGEIGE